ncbi:MAG TPA: STAS domain-containing protein [Candidatus Coprenecus merdipullorum]|nr:STAS domain-containing protein [Candidatus Coprenecus merdipullorum]
MDLSISIENGKTRARVTGRLDTTNSEEFEKKMAPMLEGGNPDIEMDCSELEYISSSGLRLFLTLQKSVNARGGKLVILNMQDPIKEIFNMTGFSRIMTIM